MAASIQILNYLTPYIYFLKSKDLSSRKRNKTILYANSLHFMNFAKTLNVNLWQIVDTRSAPAWTAVDDICIKSAKSYLFLKCALTHF